MCQADVGIYLFALQSGSIKPTDTDPRLAWEMSMVLPDAPWPEMALTYDNARVVIKDIEYMVTTGKYQVNCQSLGVKEKGAFRNMCADLYRDGFRVNEEMSDFKNQAWVKPLLVEVAAGNIMTSQEAKEHSIKNENKDAVSE